MKKRVFTVIKVIALLFVLRELIFNFSVPLVFLVGMCVLCAKGYEYTKKWKEAKEYESFADYMENECKERRACKGFRVEGEDVSEDDFLYSFIKEKLSDKTFLFIADTHGALRPEDINEVYAMNYDACFLMGDISFYDLALIVKYIDISKTYGVLGNHDARELFDTSMEEKGFTNLHAKSVYIDGISFAGFEGSARYKSGDYVMYTQEESIEISSQMENANVLISHDSGYKIMNSNNDPSHIGLKGITEYMNHPSCYINFCGHHHIGKIKTFRDENDRLKVSVCLPMGVTLFEGKSLL